MRRSYAVPATSSAAIVSLSRCWATHPLVREYSGEQLRAQRSEARKECNRRLFYYYRTLAPQLPNSFRALRGQFRYSLVTDKLSAALQIAERVYSLAQGQDDPALAHWLAIGAIWRGWARSASGDTEEGIPWIEHGIRDYRATGSAFARGGEKIRRIRRFE